MLSILIPIYNYDASELVSTVHRQAAESGIPFEIICVDDASLLFLDENKKINSFSNVKYERLDTNIGRSKIRNLLARKAAYDWLLFLDSDVLPKDRNFIQNYIPYLDNVQKAVNGGLLYEAAKPSRGKLLRWVYGNDREALPSIERKENPYRCFLTLNFLVHKGVFEKVCFNESIPNLRHEDTLFSYNLMQHEIPVLHIDNPIYHLGLDTFDAMIRKEKESLYVLKYLTDGHLLATDYLKISKLFSKIRKFGLTKACVLFHKLTRRAFMSNLSGNFPSMLVFDLYRIGYLCTLEKN